MDVKPVNNIKGLALQFAITQLGITETAKNSSPQIDKYLKSVGLGPGYAWCQAFVFFCFQEAAKQLATANPLPKTAGVLACWNKTTPNSRITKSEALQDPSLLQPGYQFIMDFGKGLGHTGIIERIEGDVLHTIEGNSNDAGSREGTEVCRRTRKIGDKPMKGFIKY
ncbi:MAG: CHAP domain-containing protein [Flavipsychrobacter sp.]